MRDIRLEKDRIGTMEIASSALHGIHTQRSIDSICLLKRPVQRPLIHAFGAVKLACARMNRKLRAWEEPVYRCESEIVRLTEAFQIKEKEFAHIVKVARTECHDAVLITLGREMGAYADAFARAENLIDATQNADVFVEVSGIIKACASNLQKVCSDLRFLSSGPEAGIGEIRLPIIQSGSSIMPGKINPVIPEAVTQATLIMMANDIALTNACEMGRLELNPFMPLIAECLLQNLDLIASSCRALTDQCIRDLAADEGRCNRHVESSTAILTVLVEKIGYHNAEMAVEKAKNLGKSVRQIIINEGVLNHEEFDFIISPEQVTKLGNPDIEEEER